MLALASWSMLREGAKIDLVDTLVRLALLMLAWLVLMVAQRSFARRQLFTSLSLQLNLLVLVVLLLVLIEPVFAAVDPRVHTGVKALGLFLGVTIGLRLMDAFFFDRLPKWRNKPQVPLVLRDIARWVVGALAAVLIIRSLFPTINLNVLAVSSLVVGYIVGNATQDTLGNLFAGLALNAERPFQIGDWVTVGGHTGLVIDTTWRATRLRTKTEDYIVIPNSSIGKESIVNFSRPTRNHGCYITIGLHYDTPPTRAREVILGVLQDAPDVCQQPAPSVTLTNFGNFAVDYKLKFFISDFARLDPIQSTIMERLWYAFRREGISIPYPVQEELYRDAAAEAEGRQRLEGSAIRESLSKVDLFQALSADETERLARAVKLRRYAPGETLCRQGEAGSSFYIIREGRVAVYIDDQEKRPMRVATLEAGAFFGEMSLLTGEPRAGTVTTETDVAVLCISKPDFAILLQGNAELASQLAAALQKRLAAKREIMESMTGTKQQTVTHSALTARILQFFGMG